MPLIYRIFRQDPQSREGVIVTASALGIVVNLFFSASKIIVGWLSASFAIVSEGINDAADAMTSVLTLVGIKLAKKHPNEKHPFGYGRMEYLFGMIIAVVILVTGVEILFNAVRLILRPETLRFSAAALGVEAVSAVVKFCFGGYTIRKGGETGSHSLQAVGAECRHMSLLSLVTIASAVIYLTLHVSVDAYVACLIGVMVLWEGGEVLRETASEMVGRPGEKELAEQLYREIRGTEGILNAEDMMLHNYGPEAYVGSVNVELEHSRSVGDAYRMLHRLQLKLRDTYRVEMVFGVYAVDNDHSEIRAMRTLIGSFAAEHPHVESFHAVYLSPDARQLYCDFVVDYQLRDWEGLQEEFRQYMQQHCPDKEIHLTVKTRFV